MDRRRFIQQTGTLLAGAALAPYALSENRVQAGTSKPTGSGVLPMNRKWRYSRTFVEGGHSRDFDLSRS